MLLTSCICSRTMHDVHKQIEQAGCADFKFVASCMHLQVYGAQSWCQVLVPLGRHQFCSDLMTSLLTASLQHSRI